MGIHIRSVSPSVINMLRLVIVAVLVACAYASLVPFGYSGLAGYHGYSPLGYSAYSRPLAYAAGYNAPVAYASHAASPTYERVSQSVDITREPVEQHGYVIKY